MAWDKDKAVQHLNANARASSKGFCARFVRHAVSAGGIDVPPTSSAKDYGPSLIAAGFQEISPTPSNYEKGDVVVIQPATGHSHGHMAMYNGTQWVSDFKQQNGLYPGETYRTEKPDYKVYRYQAQ